MKIAEIAAALNLRLENGSPDIKITGVTGIKDAATGDITFVANPKYGSAAKRTRASAIIVTEDFPSVPAALLRSKNPYLAFAHALELFSQPPRYYPGVHPTAVVPSGKDRHRGPSGTLCGGRPGRRNRGRCGAAGARGHLSRRPNRT